MVRPDVDLAAHAAEEAGRALLAIRATGGVDLGGRGDRAAQAVIAEAIRTARPADAVLSEEAADDLSRLAADRVWIIDPLDGTREYAEQRVDWAVHVALWAFGELACGAVSLPALGATYRSDLAVSREGGGTERSGSPRIAVSRTRPPRAALAAAATLGAELVPMGSAGFKVLAVVRGEVDAYLHAGGQFESDSAAPVAVATGSGLWTSRLSGEPLRYNRVDPYLPDLLVCRPELAEKLLRACAVDPAQDLADPVQD